MALVEPKQGFASLDRSLWSDYSLARHMGLSDLGTYNPGSRLPSGAPSDHARYPALAFDVGFTPPIGQAHPLARTFFETMIGRPEVAYVILGGVIWSRERGRHAYTEGGHEGHVHVSGVGAQAAAAVPVDRSSSSGVLSGPQLAELWTSQGGNPRAAQMAAAVALRESGGNPQAHALTSREDSRGLWQINVRAHPEWRLRNLYDPRANAAAAIRISRNGVNWGPWTTAAAARADVASGRVPEVVRPGGDGGGILGALGQGLSGSLLDLVGIGGVPNPLAWVGALVQLVAFVTNPVNWLRVFEVVAGFTLLLAGLALLAKEFGARGGAVERASAIVPAGRVRAAVRA